MPLTRLFFTNGGLPTPEAIRLYVPPEPVFMYIFPDSTPDVADGVQLRVTLPSPAVAVRFVGAAGADDDAVVAKASPE